MHDLRRHRLRLAVRYSRRWPVRRAHHRPRVVTVNHQLRAVPVQHPVHSERHQHHHPDHCVVRSTQTVPSAC